ncbi:hypothetical protein Dimus_038844 [Dionaea muscipula]
MRPVSRHPIKVRSFLLDLSFSSILISVFGVLSDMVQPRIGCEFQDVLPSAQGRTTGTPPSFDTQEKPQGGARDLMNDHEDGAITVRLSLSTLERFQEFQRVSPEKWERFLQFQRFMAMQEPPGARTSSLEERLREKFLEPGSPKFTGSTDASEASDWMMAVEQTLQRIECTTEHKVSLATTALEGATKTWWRRVEQRFEVHGEKLLEFKSTPRGGGGE